jgi:hypothetical protein
MNASGKVMKDVLRIGRRGLAPCHARERGGREGSCEPPAGHTASSSGRAATSAPEHLRAVVEHPNMSLAGVYVYSQEKAGRDYLYN